MFLKARLLLEFIALREAALSDAFVKTLLRPTHFIR